MTKEALEYCARGVVQYLSGDMELFKRYVHRAMEYHKEDLCACGGAMVDCRYQGKKAKLCTRCGAVWNGDKPVLRCRVQKIA